jgi:hypothetical protein
LKLTPPSSLLSPYYPPHLGNANDEIKSSFMGVLGLILIPIQIRTRIRIPIQDLNSDSDRDQAQNAKNNYLFHPDPKLTAGRIRNTA